MSVTLLPRAPITDALGKRAKAREAEKAAAYERIDELEGALHGLLGLLHLIWSRPDVSPDLREDIETNHRTIFAREILA